MSKWTEQNIFKGRSPKDQKTDEEILNIPGHRGNANHDFTSLLLEGLLSRIQTTTNVGEDVGEKEPTYIVGWNVN
jgi:hypothetical protein